MRYNYNIQKEERTIRRLRRKGKVKDMKHITMEYGQETNLIESTIEEFDILKKFLEKHGVLIRKCSICDGIVTWQAKNPYQIWVNLNRNECESIKKNADEEMESKNWCR